MFRKSLKKEVMKVIKNKINDAQKKYDEARVNLITSHLNQLKELGKAHKTEKAKLLANHVDSILNKII